MWKLNFKGIVLILFFGLELYHVVPMVPCTKGTKKISKQSKKNNMFKAKHTFYAIFTHLLWCTNMADTCCHPKKNNSFSKSSFIKA